MPASGSCHPLLEVPIRRLVLTLLLVCVLSTPVRVSASSAAVLKKREHRQVVSLHRWEGALTFFRNHRRQAHSRVGRRETRRAHVWVSVIRRELAETRALLTPRSVYPAGWLDQAACIRSHEGAWTSNTGNGYYGAYQFLLSTWQSVGGQGYPHLASPDEQTRRAFMVWRRDGGSWREWGTAGMCGLL